MCQPCSPTCPQPDSCIVSRLHVPSSLAEQWLQQCCLIADSGSERNRRQGSLLLNCNGRCGCQGRAAVCLFGNEPRVCKHGKNRNAVVAYLSAAHVAMLPCDPSWPIKKISVSYLSYQHADNVKRLAKLLLAALSYLGDAFGCLCLSGTKQCCMRQGHGVWSQSTGPYIKHQLHAQLLSCCQSYDAGYGCCTARLQCQSYAATSLEFHGFHRLGCFGRYSSGHVAECQTHRYAQDSCCVDPGASTGCACQVQQRSVRHRHYHCTSDLLETTSALVKRTQALPG